MSSTTHAPATQVSSRTGLTPFLFGDSTTALWWLLIGVLLRRLNRFAANPRKWLRSRKQRKA